MKNLNTTKLIIVALITLIFIFILYSISSRFLVGKNSGIASGTVTPNFQPTKILTNGTINQSLFVNTVMPINDSIDVPLTSKIILTFNRSFTNNEVNFLLTPPIPYALTKFNNEITIKFNSPLLASSLYTYTITYSDQRNLPQSFSFTTAGPTPSKLPDTKPSGALAQYNQFQLQNNPDVYLASYTPYQTSDFTVTSAYIKRVPDHFAFTVTLTNTDKNAAKSQFIIWLHSLQLTDSQIQILDIKYRQ